jgi:hypothetical protein
MTMTKTNNANLVAQNTADAYSRDRYTDAAWTRIAKRLLAAGFTVEQAEWTLRSKHMRWAADFTGRSHSVTAADFDAYLADWSWNARYGKGGLARILGDAIRELGAPEAPDGAELAGATEGEDIADLIDLARDLRATQGNVTRFGQRAAQILARIEGRAK